MKKITKIVGILLLAASALGFVSCGKGSPLKSKWAIADVAEYLSSVNGNEYSVNDKSEWLSFINGVDSKPIVTECAKIKGDGYYNSVSVYKIKSAGAIKEFMKDYMDDDEEMYVISGNFVFVSDYNISPVYHQIKKILDPAPAKISEKKEGVSYTVLELLNYLSQGLDDFETSHLDSAEIFSGAEKNYNCGELSDADGGTVSFGKCESADLAQAAAAIAMEEDDDIEATVWGNFVIACDTYRERNKVCYEKVLACLNK